MDASSQMTTNHDTIVHWASNRDAKPIRLREENSTPGLGPIQIAFKDDQIPDHAEEITWEEFLDDFENRKLAFVYRENEATGEVSKFYRIVKREDYQS